MVKYADQMTARTDRSDPSRYSPAYATGREFGAKGNCLIVRVFDWLIANRSDWECHGKGMNVERHILWRFGRTTMARTRSAADDSITATLSVVPDPLKTTKTYNGKI